MNRLLHRLGSLLGRNRMPATLPVASSPRAADDLPGFWKDAGHQWATEQAASTDLDVIGALHERTTRLDSDMRAREIVVALQKVWSEGFSSESERFAWDGMPNDMPDWALAAFVEGAADVWLARRASA